MHNANQIKSNSYFCLGNPLLAFLSCFYFLVFYPVGPHQCFTLPYIYSLCICIYDLYIDYDLLTNKATNCKQLIRFLYFSFSFRFRQSLRSFGYLFKNGCHPGLSVKMIYFVRDAGKTNFQNHLLTDRI